MEGEGVRTQENIKNNCKNISCPMSAGQAQQAMVSYQSGSEMGYNNDFQKVIKIVPL